MIENIKNALEVANKRGAFNLNEASEIWQMLSILQNSTKTLKEQLIENQELRKQWESDLAMAFIDEHEINAGAYTIKEVAVSAAKTFIENYIKK